MKKLKRVSILLLSIAALTATTACDFSSKKSDTTPTSDNNTNNVNDGTNTDQGNTTTPDSSDGTNTNPSSGDSSTTTPSGNNTQGQDSGDTPAQQTTKYTVTFNTNGGSSVTAQNVESGKTITSVTTTKAGCAFAGWYKDSSFTQAFNVNTPVTGTLTLYAKWTATVTFNTNSGSAVTAQTVVCGNAITAVTTSRNGYDFAGWFTDASLKTEFDTTTPITTSITLYAKWTQKATPGNIISESAAYNEGAYVVFEASSATAASNSTVSYSQDGVNWSDPINSNLIRYDDTSKTARADILGLKAGSYLVKVNNTEKESTTATLNVSADDKSGYAHFNNTNGVGAYKNDGTLKDNAVVIYVSDATKNTVTYGGKTGLANILGTSQSNPLCIRFLDTIKTCQFNEINYTSTAQTTDLLNEQSASLGGTKSGYKASDIISNGWNSYSNDIANGITELNGLTSKCSYSSGEFDTYWNMLDIKEKSNITLEGVGENAGLFQWGLTWSKCNSIEVKNLTFTDYTEDACSFQAGSNSDVRNYGNYWVHNCTFNRGKNHWDLSYEQDKHYGDGATDFKFVNSITSSYNVFNNCKKTGLVGGSNSNYTMNVTFHHNFYNNVGSRLPLGRQANMHIYNNYYYNCSTCQDIRANAFVLSESNYFEGCNNPQKVSIDSTYSSTVIKSYNDYLTGCGTSAATIVTTRDKQLSGNCKPDGSTDYTNFDTNSSLFYYDSTNKKSDVSILTEVSNVKSFVPTVAGAGTLANFGIGEFSDVNTDVETFTVNFETNGGTSINSQTVVSGTTIRSVSTTRSGYTFNGWSTKADLSDSFDVTTPITGTLTLYAKWEENTSSQTTDTLTLSIPSTTGEQSSNFTAGDFTITATSDKKVTVNQDNIALGGGGSTTYRSLIANVGTTDEVTIVIDVRGGSNNRYLVIADSNGNSKSETLVTGSVLTIKVSGSTTYYLYSKSSGLSIYSLTITI